jgi:anti-repressor protein
MKDSPDTPAPQPQFPDIIDGDIGGDSMQTVNACDLQAFIGVGRDFSSSTKDCIAQYGFCERHDFPTLVAAPRNGGAGNRGKRIEYAIRLDMA